MHLCAFVLVNGDCVCICPILVLPPVAAAGAAPPALSRSGHSSVSLLLSAEEVLVVRAQVGAAHVLEQ
jgi:hypothetical protein